MQVLVLQFGEILTFYVDFCILNEEQSTLWYTSEYLTNIFILNSHK